MSIIRFPNTIALALAIGILPTAATAQELIEEGTKPAPVVGVAPATDENTAAGSIGDPAPGETPAVSAAPKEGAKDPASGLEMRGLMWMLSSTMRGQRVVAVASSDVMRSSDLEDTDYKHATTLVEKLQAIAATQSDDGQPETPWNRTVIPFKVGNSYAIAPETREGVNADLRGLSALDVTARGTLLLDSLLQMSPKHLAAIGSEAGLAVSSLPKEIQASLMRSFRPPLKIIEVKPSTYTDENGMVKPSVSHEEVGRLDEPMDWSKVHVRAHLRLHGANVQLGQVGTTIGYRMDDSGYVFQLIDDNYQSFAERGAELPIFQVVPNSYKPSDLEGRRYTQPFGLSGVWKVEDIVQHLSRNTGLKLKVWQLYKNRQVFIGTPEVTTGEVIDALRLCLTASWRKLGDTYLLAWDRMPLQAIQQMARETSETAARQVRKRRSEMESDPGWLEIVRTLPFDPDDPLTLTPEQRAHLFPTKPSDKGVSLVDNKIPFTEMTPEQQAYLRKRAEAESIDLPEMGPENPALKRPYTEEDIRNSSIQPNGTVVVSVLVPGRGWVRAADTWDGLGFNGWQLQRAANKTEGAPPRDILEGAPPEVREMLANMKPMALPSATRVAIVPVLGPARLNELADEMKRHGLNVLFYPALFGGYATFPTKAFPLHPSLRGEDGLAAAVSAMKPKGIKVVGYLNTLAWQNASDKVHWLSKYPQWQDVDVLGRTRTQWIEEHPETPLAIAGLGFTLSSYVRPTEPMVEARIKALVADFALKRDTVGIAFGEYSPSSVQNFMPGRQVAPPPLGFALADRLAVFEKTGQDPADTASWNDYMPASLRHAQGYMGEERANPTDPHRALVARLLADAKARRKNWTTYLLDESPLGQRGRPEPQDNSTAAKPKADMTIRSLFQSLDNQTDNSGLLFPISKRNFFAAMSEMEGIPTGETIPESLLNLPSLAVYNLIFSTERTMKSRTLPLVALDFRTAPETITETMKWIEPPQPTPATPKAKPAPGPAAVKAKPSPARSTR